jgi:serine/threonine protein kinase/streptogramin lyase
VADLALGEEVAGYRIDARLARGGMGVVYRATHLGLDRPVALKVIARELAGDASFRERFLRESRLAARLDHPAVVPVYDSREVDGELFVAMRLVEGGDLRALIEREGPLPPARATALLGQVAEALDAAHAAGIVHRDVKPHNVLVEGERAYLSDFGLAKAIDESAASMASVVGTAAYMSPEQWRGEAVGPPADIYSLGCVLFEAVTGIVPFARADADPESTPRMPAGLEGAIEKATAPRPEDRFRTAGELIAAARAGEGGAERPTQVLGTATMPRHPTERGRPDQRPTERGRPNRRKRWARSTADAETVGRVDRASEAGGGGRRGSRRGVALAGGAVLVVAAAVVAVLLLGGGSSGPKVSAPVTIGEAPLRIAAGSEKIWVLSEPEGTLTRIDAESDEIIGAPIDLGKGVAAVAVGGGSVWVTDAKTGELLRVNDESGAVTQKIEVGGHPGPVVYGGGRVWVADTKGAGITAVNAKGGHVVRHDLPPRIAPLRLATGAGGLWVSNAEGDTVRRIDLGDFTLGKPIAAGRRPAGITVADGLVWVADTRSDSVTRIDPSLQAVSGAPIPVGQGPGGIDAGTSAVWVTIEGEDAVRRLGLPSGEPDGGPIPVGPKPGAIAVGTTAVWVANDGDGSVTRIEP